MTGAEFRHNLGAKCDYPCLEAARILMRPTRDVYGTTDYGTVRRTEPHGLWRWWKLRQQLELQFQQQFQQFQQ